MTRGQALQFLCPDRVWSRPRDSMSRQDIFMSRQSLVKTKGFYVAAGYFYVATEFGQGEEILCRDREFDVTTEFPEVKLR